MGKEEFIMGFQLVALVLTGINTISIIPASLAKRRVSSAKVDTKHVAD